MEFFANKGLGEAQQTFIENVFLAVLEYILTEGIDAALGHLSDVPVDILRLFPHIEKALKEKRNKI